MRATADSNSRKPPTLRQDERGSVLILGLIVSIMLLLTTVAAVNLTVSQGKAARYSLDRTEALSVAEGTTEAAQKRMLEQVANFQAPDMSGTLDVGDGPRQYTVTAIGDPFQITDRDGVTRGMQHYKISASVQTGDGYASIDRVVDLNMTPLFQFMIFYNDDLEILPGPDMRLGGRVHANADIYAGSNSTLRVDTEYFRCTGNILRRRKDTGDDSTGTVTIKATESEDFVVMGLAEDSEHPEWATLALDTWNGTVQDGAHGVKEIAVPEIGTIKAFQEDGSRGYYHENADLVIVDGAAFDGGGNPLSLPPGTVSETQIYDAREGKYVTVTDVNVAALNASGYFPANGLLYAYRTDASSDQPNGVRLKDGAELIRPLSVVSEDPVYVQGDFNTVNKKGAAVLCDAVNLLSNAWSDSKSPTNGLPGASNTTFNLAFVTGNVPTPTFGGGNYSGGFENLPRFHENWSGRTATIRGSFIKIFESEFARSPWRYGGNVYTAPVRDWAYDPALNDLNNLPPFTPSAVYFQRVLWDDRLPVPFL